MHDPTIKTLLVIMLSFLAIGVVISILLVFQHFAEWHRNNKSPKISLKVFVKGKNSETHVDGNYNPGNNENGYAYGPVSSSITRTVTFEEEEKKKRFVFDVTREQFDLIFEGDHGILLYQGTRFLDFRRVAAFKPM